MNRKLLYLTETLLSAQVLLQIYHWNKIDEEESCNSYFVSKVTLKPSNSHEWPKQNFSLQYQYNIKQTSDENEKIYIKLRIISKSNTNFSKLTSQELYSRQ